jgi:hypothetical protein
MKCRNRDSVTIVCIRNKDGMDWIDLAEDRDQCRALVNTIMNLWVLYAGKFLSSCTIGGFSRRAQLHECVSGLYKPVHPIQNLRY